MAGILDTFTSLATSDLAGKAGRALGVDPALVTKGFDSIAPVVLGSLAKTAATPAGAASIFNKLPQDAGSGGMLSGLTELLGGGAPQLGASSFFGAGTNAIAQTISSKLGFNVRPLLNLAVPVLLGVITKTVKAQSLNPQGLADMFRSENDAFMKNPANKETAALVHSALAASDKANALRDMFDEAEWQKVRSGPVTALFHVANASPSGPVGLMKEFTAATDAVSEATKTAGATSLIGAAFGDGLAREQFTELAKARPQSRALLDGLHESVTLIARKSPADAQAYREVVLDAARRVAEASKEGGFLGIGGTRVSEAEQRALDDIRTALT
jgi:hypothetical protein